MKMPKCHLCGNDDYSSDLEVCQWCECWTCDDCGRDCEQEDGDPVGFFCDDCIEEQPAESGEGQKIFLRALAKKPDTTVWIVTGHFDREPVEFDSAHILLPSSRLRLLAEEFKKLVEALNIWHDAPEVYKELYEADRKEPT